ncbi:conserved hypothetical protein [Vibrio nigripulchritudo SOn1]|uniref:Polysaccharide deacetylase n=1 Tax=Vibrio nigripulchritudo SOn1 TaxID=1238450 RepID=A0AAV2VU49_9VIBR|nr:hypothetical protein [Vibrio nigripulchritudo]CCO48256.1 conserved hypothetical protein [Vibrio nigripulchritudo SOn1]
MNITICKWKDNCDSPVMFMVDDLANVWVDLNANGRVDLGEDWGYALRSNNSSIRFLEEQILKKFPKVKVNFYVPVGKRVGMISDSSINMYSNTIDESESVKSFFRKLHEHPNYELSYHGTNHGKVYPKAQDFQQEWETYTSLSEAIDIICRGKEIFKNATGEYPRGGKYCGYKSGKYGDRSIIGSNFIWWHRYWNKGIESGEKYADIGKEVNPLVAYDITEIENTVVDIPSTVPGNIFNNFSSNKLKRIIKSFIWPFIFMKKSREIDFLLKNKLVISIQEHISPARNDGKTQNPNIFTDKDSLLRIFRFLSRKNVWYCTGSELAEYYLLRKETKVVCVGRQSFQLSFDENKLPFILTKDHRLTLYFSGMEKSITQPDGEIVSIVNGVATIGVLSGIFTVNQ